MLTSLAVRDFAVVRALDIGFAVGLSVVTGETGAGKSILLDALGLVLGDRGSSDVVRPTAARAEVCAEFDLRALPDVQLWLRERELDDTDDANALRLRRTIASDGRSRAYINGRAVNVQDLAEIGQWLADIHGQHAHQSMLRRPTQLAVLDAHANVSELARATRSAWANWQSAEAALRALRAPEDDGDELEWLDFQLRELQALADADYGALSDEHRRLAGSDARRATLARAGEWLHGGDTDAYGLLHIAANELRGLRPSDGALDAIIDKLQRIGADIEDSARTLHRYEQQQRADPGRLAALDEQLAHIHAAARKHRVAPAELTQVQTRLAARRGARAAADDARPRLAAELATAHARYLELATRLQRERHAAAGAFIDAVCNEIRALGMPHAVFDVRWLDDSGSHGLESVEFLVSTNAELPPAPLQRVASGGELSRISLSIQTVAAARSHIPTLVLDEADSGIGGGIAEIVGQTLRRLGRHTQILCVTHVPQVAAQGTQHLRVRKDDAGTHIDTLDDAARVDELARMIGGVRVTQKAIARAEEMLRLAAETPIRSSVAAAVQASG